MLQHQSSFHHGSGSDELSEEKIPKPCQERSGVRPKGDCGHVAIMGGSKLHVQACAMSCAVVPQVSDVQSTTFLRLLCAPILTPRYPNSLSQSTAPSSLQTHQLRSQSSQASKSGWLLGGCKPQYHSGHSRKALRMQLQQSVVNHRHCRNDTGNLTVYHNFNYQDQPSMATDFCGSIRRRARRTAQSVRRTA